MRRSHLLLLFAGIAIALGVALLSPLASSSPDGLERVAQDQGFADEAEEAPYELLPGYSVPGIEDERAGTIIASVVGVLLAAGLTLGAGLWLGRDRRRTAGEAVDTAETAETMSATSRS